MILSDKTIRELIKEGKLIENPINMEECIQPGSYDIYLGEQFSVPIPNELQDTENIIDIKSKIEYKTEFSKYYVIPPKGFVLAVTKEIVNLPENISAFVEGRSSIGRLGLFIQNAGWIDSGFRGTITLELFNTTDYPIKIYSDIRIGQLVFCKNDEPSEKPYRGKYQHQINVEGSRLYIDKEISE